VIETRFRNSLAYRPSLKSPCRQRRLSRFPRNFSHHLPKVYGEVMAEMPRDLYIPPDALEIILESFEGPLDLLLYLIRRANINVLDIPMAPLTAQYLVYVEAMRKGNLELAAEYLLMAAMLIEIKSRMLLPRPPKAENGEPEDPSAELVRRLIEYERMKASAAKLTKCRRPGATTSGSRCGSPTRWPSASPRSACMTCRWPGWR
jgi:hypothetical protein